MKAWSLFLFLYIFQALNGVIASYYIQNYSSEPTIISTGSLQNISTGTVVTSDNQYLVTTEYHAKTFKSAWDILLSGLTPLGSYINSLFPDLLPSIIVLLLNSIWGIIFGLSAIEFIRGFRIIGD